MKVLRQLAMFAFLLEGICLTAFLWSDKNPRTLGDAFTLLAIAVGLSFVVTFIQIWFRQSQSRKEKS